MSSEQDSSAAPPAVTNFFELSANNAKHQSVSFKEYAGKVVLVVNVASKCGFTGQYEGLEQIYQQHKDQGFVVLGFPCNGFGSQEPGTEEEICEFAATKFKASFPIMEKIEVNGEKEHPVYAWLKSQKSGVLGIKRIKWNFEKFLINQEGKVVERYSSLTKPDSIGKDVEKLLKPAA